MIHFQNKNHILMWLENNCPRKSICRALREDEVEFMGGFDSIPPTSSPGWITRVTSVHSRIWYVAVICHDHRYGIRILSDVPWGNWMGSTAKGRTALMNGDNPVEYWELRSIWNEYKTFCDHT